MQKFALLMVVLLAGFAGGQVTFTPGSDVAAVITGADAMSVVVTDHEEETLVFVWAEDEEGEVTHLLGTTFVTGKVVRLRFDPEHVTTFRLEALLRDGEVDLLGRGIAVGSATDAIDTDPDHTLPSSVDAASIADNGKGGTTGGTTFHCKKPKCRLTITLLNGAIIHQDMKKDETAFVSAANTIVSVCDCK